MCADRLLEWSKFSSRGAKPGPGAVGQFEFRSEPIPKGFKLIAVGELCATATELSTKRVLTLKGSNCDGKCDPFRVRISLSIVSVGVAQCSPTAINLNPFGINTGERQTNPLLGPGAQPNSFLQLTGGAEPRLTSGGIAVAPGLRVQAQVALAIHSEIGS